MFAATGGAEGRVWHFNGKIERPRLLTGGEPASARRWCGRPCRRRRRWVIGTARRRSQQMGLLGGLSTTSGRDHDARLVNGPTSVTCEVGLHGPRLPVGPDQYAAIHSTTTLPAPTGSRRSPSKWPATPPAASTPGGCVPTTRSTTWCSTSAHHGAEAHVALLMPTFSYRAYANDHCAFDVPFAQMIIGHTPVLQASDLELDRHREFGLSLYDTPRWQRRLVVVTCPPNPQLGTRFVVLALPVGVAVQRRPPSRRLVDRAQPAVRRTDRRRRARRGPCRARPVSSSSRDRIPEYATAAMLDALAGFLDGGGRLMYLGANGFYWVTGVDPEDPDVIEVRRWGGSQAWKAQPGSSTWRPRVSRRPVAQPWTPAPAAGGSRVRAGGPRPFVALSSARR